jgi:phosphoglycerate kinase
LGRPKGKEDLSLSNRILLKPLKKYLNKEIIFSSNPISTSAIESSRRLKNNQVLLCENIRFHPEEEEDDPIFAEKLSSLGDIYVNDAFSCCHRAHSSTHSITNFLPSYFGPMLCEEISALNRTLENPSKPSLAIIGGSKVSTKISVLKNLVLKLDSIIIGGGMANTFLFAKGAPMGNSLYEPDLKDTANEILTFSKQNNCNILLPVDIITANKLEKNIETNTSNYDECPSNQMILDIGQKSIELFKQAINSSKTILWNGPLGAFEIKPFDNSTNLLAKFTGQNTMLEKCISVAGGGDTVSALNSVKVTQQFSYVSSAGGAFLEWLEGKKLPGIEAIKSSK